MGKNLFFILFLNLLFAFSCFSQDATTLFEKAEEMTEKEEAIALYKNSYVLAQNEEKNVLADSVLFGLAKRYVNWGMLDSAKSIGLNRIREHEEGDSSKIIPAFYNLAAATLSYGQELDSALNYFLKAVKVLEQQNDSLKAAYIKFNIGNIFVSFRDYGRADENFLQALQTVETHNDSTNLSGILAAISMTKLNLGQIDLSASYAEQALDVATLRNDALGKLSAFRQMGKLAAHGGDGESAIHFYNNALKLAEQLNSAYNIAILKLELAISYNEIGKYKEAILSANKSLESAPASVFKTQLVDLYKVLSESYEKLGDNKNALKYLNLVTDLREEQMIKENNRIVNHLLVQYQTEKKDKQIVEQELLLVKTKEQNQMYFFFAIFAVLAIVFLSWIYVIKNKLNKSKLKVLKDKQEWEVMTSIITGEEQERKRLAVELHDGLSNNLFTCKLSLSSMLNFSDDFQEKLESNIEMIDHIRKEARMMAHNLLPFNLDEIGLQETVKEYICKISEGIEDIGIYFQAFGEDHTLNLDRKVAIVLYRIIQELIGNAMKYAHATEIDIQFFQENNQLKITVEDNGIGFDINNIPKGQGLGLMDERLSLIHAKFEIDSTENLGTQISIQLTL